MKRRTFIQKTAALSVGMSILPTLDAAARPTIEAIKLATEPQIRHGLLSLNSVLYKDWVASLQKNIFYKNGHSPSTNDLLTYSFIHKNKAYLIGIKGQEIVLSIDGETIKTTLENNRLYQNQDIELSLIQANETMDVVHQAVLLPIEEKTVAHQHQLDDQLLWLSGGTHVLDINKTVLQLQVF